MTPRSLLLQLLSAYRDGPLEVAHLVRAGAVFGFEPGAVRVALSRLSRDVHVEQAGRGRWQLAPQASRLAGQVATWRDLEHRVRPWEGGWIGVATRRTDRPLALLGFRELRPGLQVRPDNRVEGADGLRDRLIELGLEPGTPVFAMGPLGPEQAEAEALWDTQALEAGYAAARAELAATRATMADLPLADAAREAFVAGGRAIRVLAFDPLLPAALVDVEGRRALGAELAAFDELGRKAWRAVLEEVVA